VFQNVLYVVEIILALTLIGMVTLQAKNLGAGAVFGGDTSFKTGRRGVERTIFYLTTAVSVAFFVVAILILAIAT
jgi:protein translocase SecG subunit